MKRKLGGYQGKILEVDLSSFKFTELELPENYMENFIGGAGINIRLAYDYIKPGEGALNPGNSLIFGAGPFVGTTIPGSSKGNVTFLSPVNDSFGTCGSGQFGKLKFAGYDNLVITGKADKPVFLKITEKGANFCDASHLWGKDVWEATDAIWDEIGTNYTVAAIGPAGENLVRNAGVIIDKFGAFARLGIGTVMGSKNLKAIAVNGSSSVSAADPGSFIKAHDKLWADFNKYPLIGDWRKYGTIMSLEPISKLGAYGTKNYMENYGSKTVKEYNLNEMVDRFKIRDVACLSCPVGCKHHLRLLSPAGKDNEISISCLNATLMSLGTFTGLSG
jgi:aldehyde:ferredoxin oxidoreductase